MNHRFSTFKDAIATLEAVKSAKLVAWPYAVTDRREWIVFVPAGNA